MSINSLNIILTLSFAVAILFVWLSFYPENLHFLSEKLDTDNEDDFSIIPNVATLQTKVLIPLSRKISRFNKKSVPRDRLDEIEIDLKAAGKPYNMTPIEYYNLGYAYFILFAALGMYGCLLLELPIAIALVLAMVGLSIPKNWLNKLIDDRKTDAEVSLPNILDLISVCMSSGMTLLASLEVICANNEGILVEELRKVKNDISSGEEITEAFKDLTVRLRSKRINLVYQNVKLSEEYGTPISDKLKVMADVAREDVFELTKQKAAKASQFVLMPVILFIFPSVGILVIGPFMSRLSMGG